MRQLDDIYNTRIMELAAAMPRTTRLSDPGVTAAAHSKLCGSSIEIDVTTTDGRVSDYGQTVKACLLGQAAAAIVGREIVGASPAEIKAAGLALSAMLKDGAPPPSGRFAELAVLEPVRHYRARHGSVMLVFDALNRAFDTLEARAIGAGSLSSQPPGPSDAHHS